MCSDQRGVVPCPFVNDLHRAIRFQRDANVGSFEELWEDPRFHHEPAAQVDSPYWNYVIWLEWSRFAATEQQRDQESCTTQAGHSVTIL